MSFVLPTALLLLLLLGQSYKEDISDFLPLNNKYQKALQVYQNISGADHILAIFQCKDTTKVEPNLLTEAIETYLEQLDGHIDDNFRKRMVTGVDVERFSDVTDFAYHHIPYFLTDADYLRLDRLLRDSSFVPTQIEHVKQMLMFPASGLLSENFQKDPLNIFTPVVAKLQPSSTATDYELYDGYIFSKDLKVALVVMTSPYGASETERNAVLLSDLEQAGHATEQVCTDIKVSLIGAPVIAVGNSKQIKNDSAIAVLLAVLLIVFLLFAVFRNFRNILLIVLSIAWGWLFAMGMLALVHNNVSVIVIGISSVILGIAVNYPLHLIAHLNHTPDIKSALREIVMPLVVGNITTVGAFLALVPLKSVALRDLGLFSSFLLVGTILFVLIFLPHLVSVKRRKEARNIFSRFGDFSFESKPWIVWSVVVLTLFFGYFSLRTSFDANITHINYMTDAQKSDFATLQKMMGQAQKGNGVYVVATDSTMEGALRTSETLLASVQEMEGESLVNGISACHQFLSSGAEQQHRLQRWEEFVAGHSAQIEQAVRQSAEAEGFSESTFDDFMRILHRTYAPIPADSFQVLFQTALSSHVITDSANHQFHVVEVLAVDQEHIEDVERRLDQIDENGYAFDVASMNSSIATSISDDFNYIGWACGLIVFLFLWLSLGSIELATLSFLPMAVSWVWILGIMALLHIQFNVVNVILATFIFGQGDDYTIFMTEGCQYEYAYRRKLLASYKNSIIVSALIMFIGIGTLIIARHPALHSLAEVTIVGMFSVVLMACIFPPLIFKWMVSDRNGYRVRPFSIVPFFVSICSAVVFFSQLATAYVLGLVLFVVKHPTKKSKAFFHSYIRRCLWFDVNRVATTKFTLLNPHGESFSKPSIIVCNHQSMLDMVCLMAISDKLVIVANEKPRIGRMARQVFKWMDNCYLPAGEAIDESWVSRLLSEGYSVVVFPEREVNVQGDLQSPLPSPQGASPSRGRLEGAFSLSERNQVDIVPLLLHGTNHVFPRDSFCIYPGEVTMSVGERITPQEASPSWGRLEGALLSEYEKLRREKETASYYRKFVEDRYRYKGIEVFTSVRKALRDERSCSEWVRSLMQEGVTSAVVINSGYGELALLLALCCPDKNIIAVEAVEDKRLVAKHSSEGIVGNLTHLSSLTSHLSPLTQQYQTIIIKK